eukprot:2168445-Rhodomonas_salina.1
MAPMAPRSADGWCHRGGAEPGWQEGGSFSCRTHSCGEGRRWSPPTPQVSRPAWVRASRACAGSGGRARDHQCCGGRGRRRRVGGMDRNAEAEQRAAAAARSEQRGARWRRARAG